MPDKFLTTQIGGMNDYIEPDFLPETSYARGINITSRGGKVHTRPRYRKLLDLPAGRFQGAFPLFDNNYVVIAGTVYKTDGETYTAVPNVAFSPYAEKVWATPVFDYLFMNDGVGAPAIVGPYSNRHLSMQGDDPELPCGTVCAFGQSRIFFADRTRRILLASDVYQAGDPESVLRFTEGSFIKEIFSIRQPASYGRIMAMQFVRNPESGTGLGQLVVAYEGGICAYNVAVPRSTWLDTQLGQSWFTHNGCGGSNSFLTAGNDLFYRPAEGFSTIRSDQETSGSGIRTLPLSMNISNTMARDQLWTLEHVSMSTANNRVFVTSGMRIDETYGDYYFDSLISLDLASFYLSGETQMTFDGIWTGPRITQTFTGKLRGKVTTFLCVKTDNGGNSLWYLDEDAVNDVGDIPVRSRVYTRKFFFADNAYMISKFRNAEIWLEGMKDDCSVALYFRGDNELWQLASDGEFKVPYYTPEHQDYRYILPQGRAKVRIGVVQEATDPVAQRELRAATGFQFCIQITGTAKVARVRFTTEDPMTNGGEISICDSDETDILLTETDDGAIVLYDFDGEFLQ